MDGQVGRWQANKNQRADTGSPNPRCFSESGPGPVLPDQSADFLVSSLLGSWTLPGAGNSSYLWVPVCSGAGPGQGSPRGQSPLPARKTFRKKAPACLLSLCQPPLSSHASPQGQAHLTVTATPPFPAQKTPISSPRAALSEDAGSSPSRASPRAGGKGG